MPESLKGILEALLFASDHPLSAAEIKNWLPNFSIKEINTGLSALKNDYDEMGRSFALREVAKGYQFRTKSDYASYILRMHKTSPSRLSHAALETLAIVAYKQPVLRQDIERIRGVDAGGILRTLLEKGLIRIVGRKNLPGRPLIYGTTKSFLEVFDLTDLNSLPKLSEIRKIISDGENASLSCEGPQEESNAIERESLVDE